MQIEIDEQKILTEILERDGSIHEKIKDRVRENLVNKIETEIEETYFKSSWNGLIDEIKDEVLEDITAKQDAAVKKILRDFYDGYRYGKKDVTILKKLKELLEEE